MLWKAQRRMLYTVALARGGRGADQSRTPPGEPGDPGSPPPRTPSAPSEDELAVGSLAVGGFEHQVMLALLRRGELSTMGVVDELTQVTGRRWPASSVLLALGWLEETGMLLSRLEGSAVGGSVHSSLFFRVSPRGREALREARHSYLALWDGVEPELDDGEG